MAPRKLTQIERWIGTEAERLALDASGFSPGSTFFERDTGSMHKWDGTSWGKEIITVADIAGIKTAIESLDNKELATELTLAQILTILGGTAADIGTLKLENGQIKGYDGTDWQPVRVNDAGELILASEVTVNAEGLSVDLGKLVLQAKNPSGVPVDMKSDTEGNLKVSLSGTIMEHYGATIDQRPDVSKVPAGAVYMAVNTEQMWQSNGFEWVVLV